MFVKHVLRGRKRQWVTLGGRHEAAKYSIYSMVTNHERTSFYTAQFYLNLLPSQVYCPALSAALFSAVRINVFLHSTPPRSH